MATSKARTKRARRKYTSERREAVLRDVEELGQGGAARKHGVPPATVSLWCQGAAAAKAKKPTRGAKRAAKRSAKASEARRATVAAIAAPPASTPVSPSPTRRTAHRYTPSEKAQAVEYAAAHGVSAASKALGMSRIAIYDWQKQVELAAVGKGPSITTGPSPADIDEQRDREVLAEWRKHPGLGPSQVRNQLRRGGVKVSVRTARRVMEDAGYRTPKVRRDPHDKRYEAIRPNHLWHLDFVHRHVHRAETWTLILIDDYSRYVVGHGVDDRERGEMVIRTFEEATSRHGRPEAVMHDKGSAFWSWRGIGKFTSLLTEMGIDQVVAEAKEHNGKVEVFNGNLHKELFDKHRFWDVAEMKRRLETHLHWYNHARTHHALGGLLVPADRYYGRAEEVLARIESGTLRDGDELLLRERCLELFKVVSRGGVPEVWLLGQRLMPGVSP